MRFTLRRVLLELQRHWNLFVQETKNRKLHRNTADFAKIARVQFKPVVFNLFCSIAPLQEHCYEIAPIRDFSVVQKIIVFWK